MHLLLSVLPILTALLLLVALHWPAARAMSVCAAVTAAIVIGPWSVRTIDAAAASVEAVLIASTILYILFGAVLLLNVMRASGALATIQRTLASVSPDRRIQAVLIAWLLGSLLEGAAGFGTPAAVTAPLLIGLGFPPVLAVTLALSGASTAVSFGAVGTPLLVGMARGLGEGPGSLAALEVGREIASRELFLVPLMPAALVTVLTVVTRGRAGWRDALAAAPFAMIVGLAHSATAALIAHVAGPEFPSIGGPAAGIAVAVLLARKGLLVPKQVWKFEHDTAAPVESPPAVAPLLAFLPYLLMLLLLAVTRSRSLGVAELLGRTDLEWSDIFGSGISATVQPLSSPGFVLVLCALAAALLYRLERGEDWKVVRSSAAVLGRAAPTLLAGVVTVRLFVHTGSNGAGLEAMPLVLGAAASGAVGGAWTLFAPWLGALGTFLAGSATFSNMLFALLQKTTAAATGLPVLGVLALQGMGAAVGNMVAVHNVVAAGAVAGIPGQEGQVMRRTFIPMALYLMLAGVVSSSLFLF